MGVVKEYFKEEIITKKQLVDWQYRKGLPYGFTRVKVKGFLVKG
jgi:hypothetical protein